jgi:hypothetical protein
MRDTFAGNIWILIPLAAILSGTIRQWIRSMATERRLGTSTRELESEIASLTRTNEDLNQRLQNLETIVVSQTWRVLNDPNIAQSERNLHLATAAHRDLGAADAAQANQQRAEQLARRLQ